MKLNESEIMYVLVNENTGLIDWDSLSSIKLNTRDKALIVRNATWGDLLHMGWRIKKVSVLITPLTSNK